MKHYTVQITTYGYTFNNVSENDFYAKNAADAIKQARKMMRDNGHTRQDGPVDYRAYLSPSLN